MKNLKEELASLERQLAAALEESGSADPAIAHHGRDKAQRLAIALGETNRLLAVVQKAGVDCELTLEALENAPGRELAMVRTHLEDALHRLCRALGEMPKL